MRASTSFLLCTLIACTGSIDEPRNMIEDPPINPYDPPPGFCDDAPASLAGVPMRRLSPVEYDNTVRDLLFDARYDAPLFPEQTTERGFENFAANTSSVPARLVEGYGHTAFRAAAVVMADDALRSRVVGCEGGSTGENAACARSFLETFGTRALRRPLTDEEFAQYSAFIEDKTVAIDFDAAIELAIASLMQAPQFSYRVEDRGAERADAYETASRLSYLLWQTMPDDTLFAAAAADELRTVDQLEAQARRMLEDDRAQAALSDFHRQWLQFGKMDEDKHNRKDPATFPEWNDELQSAIHEESVRFVEHVMSDDETATLSELLTSRTTFVNGPLADHYGLPAVDEWTQTELPADERAGILTRANFLAGRGLVGWGSPIFRGTFIIENMLCDHLGAPPADAPGELPPPEPGAMSTNRTRYADITAPEECQFCHARINPIGFAFENYTSTGAYRDRDNGWDVDASGELSGTDNDGEVANAIELSERLANSEDVTDCAATTWVAYSLGRRVQADDACYLQNIRNSLRGSGGNVRQLMIDIVTSPEFVMGVE